MKNQNEGSARMSRKQSIAMMKRVDNWLGDHLDKKLVCSCGGCSLCAFDNLAIERMLLRAYDRLMNLFS